MGLDMYLHVRQYVRQNNWNEETGEYSTNAEFSKLMDVLGYTGETSEYSSAIVDVPVGYWRKANAIHGWIVDNCADGVDECQEIAMSPAHVQRLIDVCQLVIKNPDEAMDYLPPTQGFFFGGYEVDDYYLDNLRHTVDVMEKVMRLAEDGKVAKVIYQADW